MDTEQNIHINTFTEGMNADWSFDNLKNTQYRYALNLRATNTQPTGSEDPNIKSGILSPIWVYKYGLIDLPDNMTYVYKIVSCGDYSVILYITNNSKLNIARLSSSTSEFTFKPICSIKTEEEYKPKNISAVLHYETDNAVILYIADGIHKIMSINIVDEKYLSKIQKDGFIDVNDVCQNNYFPSRKIRIMGTVEGQLKTSQVQYTYRFYKKHGICSKLAPLTNKIQVINSNRNKEEGNAEDTTTSIGFKLQIRSNDNISLFDNVQIYRLSYIKPNQNAEVQLIYDGEFSEITNDNKSFTFIDNGKKSLQDLTLDEFSDLNGLQIIPKVIEQNQNYLFAGNIKDDTIITFDDSVDFKSYQYNNKDNEDINKNLMTVVDGNIEVFNQQKHDYQNPYCDINHTYDSKDGALCMFQKNKTTLGGSGDVFDWQFVTYKEDGVHNLSYDTSTKKIEVGELIEIYDKNAYYSNLEIETDEKLDYNDMFSSSLLRSLKRDEVYRYGVVFFNKYGSRTNVQWIADVRTPSIAEFDLLDTDGNPQPIGIYFTIKNNSTFINKNNFVGYEIVRCDKNDQYTRNISQVATASVVRQNLVRENEKSPYYPTGFIMSQPQQVVYAPLVYDGNITESVNGHKEYPGYMTYAKSENNLYQLYNPEIQIQRKDFLNRIKNYNCDIKIESFVSTSESEPLDSDYMIKGIEDVQDDLAYENTSIQYEIAANRKINQRCLNIFFDKWYTIINDHSERAYRDSFTIGDYIYINTNLFKLSKDNKTTNTIVYIYDKFNTCVSNFSIFKFKVESGQTLYKQWCPDITINENIVDKNEYILKIDENTVQDITTAKKVSDKSDKYANHKFVNTSINPKDFDLSNNYSYNIKNIIDVKNLNFEDGFSNHQYEGNGHVLQTAIKKYKSYISTIDTDSYVNWVCSNKYDIPTGKNSQYGFTDKFEKNRSWHLTREFTNTGKDNVKDNIQLRWPGSIGAIGPGGQCFIADIDLPENIFSQEGDTLNTPFGLVLYPQKKIDVSKVANDPTETLGCYQGTLLCNITHTATQFAGTSTAEKKYDIYYGFGNYFKIDTSDIITSQNCCVFDGDVYINNCEFVGMFKAYDFNDDKTSLQSLQTVYYIPMESKINQMFDYGMNYRNTHNPNLQLEPGSIKGLISQDRPINQYNLIYSDNNTSNNIYNTDTDKEIQDIYNQRVFYSQLKTNGENIDNWQIFKAANFIDTNAKYGELTDLYTVRDVLYYWQQYAFGKFSVNERSLVKDENSNIIQLGQGDILQRCDYISTKYGMRRDDMCKIEAQGVIYWFDFYNKCIACYDGQSGVYNFTESKNVNTYIKNNFDYKSNDINNMPTLSYDQTHQELLFSPMKYIDGETNVTMSFNLKYKIANAFYSYLYNNEFGNKIHQYKNDAIYFCKEDNNYKICSFGDGSDKDRLYDTQLCFSVNKNPSITKVFDNQQLIPAKCWDINGNEDTSSAFFTNTQFEFQTDLNSSKSSEEDIATNREGNICYPIPRSSGDYGQRLRGKWMIEKIRHNVADNYSISHIITKFRQSFN